MKKLIIKHDDALDVDDVMTMVSRIIAARYIPDNKSTSTLTVFEVDGTEVLVLTHKTAAQTEVFSCYKKEFKHG